MYQLASDQSVTLSDINQLNVPLYRISSHVKWKTRLMYGMKNELESVVYYQAWGFHCAVQTFVAKIQIIYIYIYVSKFGSL